jgi:hypothetical protein
LIVAGLSGFFGSKAVNGVKGKITKKTSKVTEEASDLLQGPFGGLINTVVDTAQRRLPIPTLVNLAIDRLQEFLNKIEDTPAPTAEDIPNPVASKDTQDNKNEV